MDVERDREGKEEKREGLDGRTSPRRSVIGTVLKSVFSVLLTLVLLELVCRFFYFVPVTARGGVFRRDDVADHSHYPYGIGRMVNPEFDVVLRMNNIGMRDDDIAIPKPPGRKRILVIGDSFMEGWGVQRGEMFTDRLEKLLKRENPDAEVVAAGVASWSTLTELGWFRRNGKRLQPDAVLLMLDTTDVAGDSFYAHRLVRDGRGRPLLIRRGERYLELPLPIHEFLCRVSYTYRVFDRIMIKKLPKTKWDYGYWDDGDDVWLPARPPEEVPQEKYEQAWSLTREALRTFRDLLDEEGIPWMVVQYPIGAEVDTDAWMPGRHTADFPDGIIAPRRFEYFSRVAKEDRLPYFSLFEAFSKDKRPARLYLPRDGHWSAAGHEVAARAVAAEILRRGWIRKENEGKEKGENAEEERENAKGER